MHPDEATALGREQAAEFDHTPGGTMSTTLDEARRSLQAAARGDWRIVETTEALARAVFREEIARSRAPVGGDERFAPFKAVDLGDGMGKAYVVAPTPPAKDTGEVRIGDTAKMRRDIEAAARTGHTSIPVSIDTARQLADRIADLEARLAEAEVRAGNLSAGLEWWKREQIAAERALAEAEKRIAALEADRRNVFDAGFWSSVGPTTEGEFVAWVKDCETAWEDYAARALRSPASEGKTDG